MDATRALSQGGPLGIALLKMGAWFVRFLASQGYEITVADPAGAIEGCAHCDSWQDAGVDHDVPRECRVGGRGRMNPSSGIHRPGNRIESRVGLLVQGREPGQRIAPVLAATACGIFSTSVDIARRQRRAPTPLSSGYGTRRLD